MLAPSKGSTWQAWVASRRHRPSSSRPTITAATSNRASVRALKPPVSTSTTTGRKPRKRPATVRFPATGAGLSMISMGHAPQHFTTGPQGHHLFGATADGRWHRPRPLHQGDVVVVDGKAVKGRAMAAGKALQSIQGAGLVEDLGIEFKGRRRRKDAGATASTLLGTARMRCAVGAEEETRMTAHCSLQQGLAMDLPLEHGQ